MLKTERIISKFCVEGEFVSICCYGNGHINDTFLAVYKKDDTEIRYILQRINDNVFKNPEDVMENIAKITHFLRKVIRAEGGDPERETMRVIKAHNGNNYYRDDENGFWRVYTFIGDAVSLDASESDEDFYWSGVAFGSFIGRLKDFPADTLKETIPDFHNTPKRFGDFKKAVEADVCKRADKVLDEINFVCEREEIMSTLMNAYDAGKLPLKVTHNDTKLNNVLLDKITRRPICVVDLDTVMPGFSVNDFGDSIRFGASTALEDEKDLNKVHFSLSKFEIYTKGFLKGAGGGLTDEELNYLSVGAIMMTLECGMRFLTDYLNGDTYFKTKYPEHNLVRCHTQFKLVSEMEENFDKMNEIIKKYS